LYQEAVETNKTGFPVVTLASLGAKNIRQLGGCPPDLAALLQKKMHSASD
jgi:hypothetical protein